MVAAEVVLVGQNKFVFAAMMDDDISTAADQISDFAPRNSNVRVTSVPEPATLGLLAVGLLAVVLLRRRRANGV